MLISMKVILVLHQVASDIYIHINSIFNININYNYNA